MDFETVHVRTGSAFSDRNQRAGILCDGGPQVWRYQTGRSQKEYFFMPSISGLNWLAKDFQ
jgi:hypothetical protein